MKELEPYIKQVLDNELGRHGIEEILKVKRFLNDLEKPHLRFNEEKARRALKIISLFKLPEDKYYGQRINLYPHQLFYFANIFGWERLDPDTKKWKRRFRRSYKSIARKNGKTVENGIIQLYMLVFDDLNGAQCYSVANTRKQALICYEMTSKMAALLRSDSKKFASSVRVMSKVVQHLPSKSKVEAMASDPKRLDGFNPSFTSVDEYHEMKTDDIIKIFETGMMMRENPYLSITTTAGFNKEYPCYKYEQLCRQILRGEKEDDTVFIDLYKLDDGDDIEDENNWYKANPMLGRTITLDTFRRTFESAKNEGESSIVQFTTKNLNEWTDSSKTFISESLYSENVKLGKCQGRCMMGIDLSYVDDISAVVLKFADGSVLTKFYCPEKKVKTRDNADGVDYRQFVKDGDIIATPGDAIDYDFIKEDIKNFVSKYKPEGIIYDQKYSTQLVLNLIKEGVRKSLFYSMYQGEKQYTEAVNAIEHNFLMKKYSLPNNKVLRWMFRNAVIVISERGGKRITKEGRANKIDGVQALAMAERGFIFIEPKNKPKIYKL